MQTEKAYNVELGDHLHSLSTYEWVLTQPDQLGKDPWSIFVKKCYYEGLPSPGNKEAK